MSYVLSGTNEILDVLATGVETVSTVRDVAKDSYLKETICLVNELNMANKGLALPGNPCPKTPKGSSSTAGLKQAVMPLRAAIYARRNPWVIPATLAVVVGVPFFLGLAAGRKRKKAA